MFLYRHCRLSGSDDGPSRRLQFGGSLLFCCAGGGNCRTFAATIPPDSRIDSFSGRLHSDGSRKHRCQRLNEFFRTASHASNRGNTRRNQRNEKSVGGDFYAGGDRNGITGLLQLAGSSLRGIKYWSGFADDFCSGTLKCSANKAPNILSFILL
jgi:hypothetical protein